MTGASSPSTYANRSASPVAPARNGYIAGTGAGIVTVGGVAASRKIHVYDVATGILLATTASASDGTYRVDGLDPARKVRVIAVDRDFIYNAVIRDSIKPAA